MAKTVMRLKNIVLTASASGKQVSTTELLVHSASIICLPTSAITEAWVGDTDTTTTNKEGMPISLTVAAELKSTIRNGGGSQASLIDLSSVYVAQATTGKVLISYMLAVSE